MACRAVEEAGVKVGRTFQASFVPACNLESWRARFQLYPCVFGSITLDFGSDGFYFVRLSDSIRTVRPNVPSQKYVTIRLSISGTEH